MNSSKKFYARLPETPGVYLMKDAHGKILYVGKAANLKHRISSYFLRPRDFRIEKLVGEIARIDHKKTDTVIEALILEASLIKKIQPPFNVREKDDKSFLYVVITDEEFPRVLLARGKELAPFSAGRARHKGKNSFGPFTSAKSIREALRIIRRILPYSVHTLETLGKFKRACFDYEVGLCPGTCISAISAREYQKTIKNITLVFQGKMKNVLANLKKEMRIASKELKFEKAEKLKRQLFALQHIQDVALITESEHDAIRHMPLAIRRIEGYDISNISGTSATGSMVVFTRGKPDKNEYRKFRIRGGEKPDDVRMLKEVLRRRLNRIPSAGGWPLPDLILVDGGRGQVNAVKGVLIARGVKIPIVGIAKGSERKRNDVIGLIPSWTDKRTLIRVRDEAHRFAIAYHRKLRSKRLLGG